MKKNLFKFVYFGMIAFCPSCSVLMDWQTKYADNIAEEWIEDAVKDATGADIDLTPITGDEEQTFDFFKNKN